MNAAFLPLIRRIFELLVHLLDVQLLVRIKPDRLDNPELSGLERNEILVAKLLQDTPHPTSMFAAAG